MLLVVAVVVGVEVIQIGVFFERDEDDDDDDEDEHFMCFSRPKLSGRRWYQWARGRELLLLGSADGGGYEVEARRVFKRNEKHPTSLSRFII